MEEKAIKYLFSQNIVELPRYLDFFDIPAVKGLNELTNTCDSQTLCADCLSCELIKDQAQHLHRTV